MSHESWKAKGTLWPYLRCLFIFFFFMICNQGSTANISRYCSPNQPVQFFSSLSSLSRRQSHITYILLGFHMKAHHWKIRA